MPVMDDGSRLVAELLRLRVPSAEADLGLLCGSGRQDAGAGARGLRGRRCWRRM